MSISALVLQESEVRLWGLGARERLRRQLREAGRIELFENRESLPGEGRALLLNGNYLFEVRTLHGLIERDDAILVCPQDGRVAAAVCGVDLVEEFAALMGQAADSAPGGITRLTPDDFAAFDEKLRRSTAPMLEPVRRDNATALENQLYGNAYRGITDLVTKFVFPKPAKRAVGLAARWGMSPNQVTTIGLLLTLAACWFFWQGQYVAGLLAGWIMTFLDTVDGKLARVTVQSSRFGDYYDHLIDLLHPPFWYIFWGLSLTGFEPVLGFTVSDLNWMIVWAYVGGRAVEGLFPLLGSTGIFTWRPFDAWFRLVTARRNPCLIILTVSVALGRPDWGFVGVAFWSALTTGVLCLRLLMGLAARLAGNAPDSWLSADDVASGPHAASFRVFGSTRSAYGGE